MIRWRLEKQQVCGSPGESVSVCVCACEVGRSPWSAVGTLLHTCPQVCLVPLRVCGLRPADREKPGAPVTAGSLDSSLPRLASLLCFIPRSQTPAEGEKSFYLPAAAASHSLLLDLSLSQSTPPLFGSPPPIRFLVTPASPLLSLSLSSFLCHKHTHAHTLDPKASLDDRLQQGPREDSKQGGKSNLNRTVVACLQL